jgi:hypothetical protein
MKMFLNINSCQYIKKNKNLKLNTKHKLINKKILEEFLRCKLFDS